MPTSAPRRSIFHWSLPHGCVLRVCTTSPIYSFSTGIPVPPVRLPAGEYLILYGTAVGRLPPLDERLCGRKVVGQNRDVADVDGVVIQVAGHLVEAGERDPGNHPGAGHRCEDRVPRPSRLIGRHQNDIAYCDRTVEPAPVHWKDKHGR